MRNRLSSKPYKHTCGVKSCQSTHPTGFPDDFHKLEVPFWEADSGELPARESSCARRTAEDGCPHILPLSSEYAQQYGLPVGTLTPLSAHAFLRQPESEDRKLRKELLEVLALKVPFGNRVAFPNEVPWPGQLKAFMPSQTLDAGRARELQTIRPASHTTALGELFIADGWGRVQGGI